MRRFRRGGVPRRLAAFFNGIVMFVVGLSVGLVTGETSTAVPSRSTSWGSVASKPC